MFSGIQIFKQCIHWTIWGIRNRLQRYDQRGMILIGFVFPHNYFCLYETGMILQRSLPLIKGWRECTLIHCKLCCTWTRKISGDSSGRIHRKYFSPVKALKQTRGHLFYQPVSINFFNILKIDVLCTYIHVLFQVEPHKRGLSGDGGCKCFPTSPDK